MQVTELTNRLENHGLSRRRRGKQASHQTSSNQSIRPANRNQKGAWAGANYSSVSVDEDLQFVTDLLADLRGEFCADDARIYATGMSSGGGFVNTIACSGAVGGEFAAFAPASGSFYTDNDALHASCAPARSPLPVLEVHGGSDGSVHYDGGEGEGGTEPAISTWLGWWAQRNGCDDAGKKVEDSFGGDVHHTTWTCGGTEGALQHWKVDDMGKFFHPRSTHISPVHFGIPRCSLVWAPANHSLPLQDTAGPRPRSTSRRSRRASFRRTSRRRRLSWISSTSLLNRNMNIRGLLSSCWI